MVVEVVKKLRDLTSSLHGQGSQGVMRRLTLWERRKEEKEKNFLSLLFSVR